MLNKKSEKNENSQTELEQLKMNEITNDIKLNDKNIEADSISINEKA